MLSFDFSVVLNFFRIFANKVGQTWCVLLEIWHTSLVGIYYCVEVIKIENNSTQHYFVYIIELKWLEFKIIVICYKLRAKLRF